MVSIPEVAKTSVDPSGFRPSNLPHGDHAVGTPPIFHNHGAPERRTQSFRQDARHEIGWPARIERHHQTNGPV
jgi:hypothetical protein